MPIVFEKMYPFDSNLWNTALVRGKKISPIPKMAAHQMMKLKKSRLTKRSENRAEIRSG
jgi:hypothetical protein